MHIKYFCPLWGSESMDFEAFCEAVKREGYDGVEMSLPFDRGQKQSIIHHLETYDLELIGQHWETIDPDVNIHKAQFRKRLENLADSPALFINSQTGKDYFSFEQNKILLDCASEVATSNNIRILHETHRSKFSFAAHIAHKYLQKMPDLRLTLDISHWCSVAETYLEDQQEAVSMALARTDHLHTRVGYPEGPQIPDPQAPEWKEALDIHLAWWDSLIELKRQDGNDVFTITPEFGAPPYMILLPHSGEPICNQWEANVYMMNLLKKRYKQ